VILGAPVGGQTRPPGDSFTRPEGGRILLVANFADRVGGGEESLLVLARGLDRERFVPHAAVPGPGEIAEQLAALGVPVATLSQPPVRPWTLLPALRAVRALGRCLARWRIDLVHAHGSRGALYAGLATRAAGVPLVWHVRVADPDPLLDPLLLRLASRVIVVSAAVATRFGPQWRDGLRVVHNGVDADYWAPGPAPERGRPGPIVLLPGRLGPAKGQAALLRAAPTVLARFPGARFVLLGHGEAAERRRLHALAERLGVAPAVEVPGWQADPRPAFRAADVVVLPSRSEGFGRVLVEAGCLGKPVIASRVGGVGEVVLDGETGLLVEPDDSSALAAALCRLLGDPDLRGRLGAAARERAVTCFGTRRHVDAVEAVYGELLDGRSTASRQPTRCRRA
jgi:glycosyltransferase involved in cell wall biosynthesis